MNSFAPLWLATLCIASAAQAEISGVYATRCTKTDEGSTVRGVQFSASQFRDSQLVYDDNACSAPSFDIAMQGPYKLDGATGAFDFEIRTVTIRPLSRQTARLFNVAELCGFRNWSAQVARNVTGLDCGATSVPTAGSIIYNIVRELTPVGAEAGESTMIQFGYSDSAHDGSSPLSRPVEFDSQIFYRL